MTVRAVCAAAVAALAVAGCGSAEGGSAGYNRPADPAYTHERVLQALGIVDNGDGYGYQDSAEECVAEFILLDPAEIKQSADSSIPTATNPSGTVGVQVSTFVGESEQMCFDRFQTALKALP